MALTILTIGALARSAGSNVQTIRYYEQVGLLKPARRTRGGQRRYHVDDVGRLEFIRHSRQFGFSLDAIRELLELSSSSQDSCWSAIFVAQQQLNALERSLSQLLDRKKILRQLIMKCKCSNVETCQVLAGVREYSGCASSDEHFGGQNNP
ncbi:MULTISPECIES: MerR family transcriptional regulator [unclassified Roseovarius]|uniref:MerR family transcriptional regulator n=1 Tax=unclassified Roseovarius TaxID=2614913 RepID=UPI00273E4AD9|nr:MULTISPECIES: MerR family transcriptional regulator [unclassified Roseovarius]